MASKGFGSLLSHFFGNDKAPLSASAAAGLTGFGVGAALGALELLESEGILRSSRSGRGRFFSAAAESRVYRRCRAAHSALPPALD